MVLVFAEHQKGQFKKAAFEAVYYGSETAKVLGTDCAAIVLGSADGLGELGKYGASKVYHLAADQLDNFDSQVYTQVLAEAADQLGANTLIVNHSSNGKSLLGRLAARWNAGSVSGVNSIPSNDGVFKVKKLVFSGKAIATYEVKSEKKVLSLMGNAIQPQENGAEAPVEKLNIAIPDSRLTIKAVNRIEGTVPLRKLN